VSTTGIGNSAASGGNVLFQESRMYGTANVDWQANRYHRFTFGGELKQSDVRIGRRLINRSSWTRTMTSRSRPPAGLGSSRPGDVVIDLASGTTTSTARRVLEHPGFTFSDPQWNQTSANTRGLRGSWPRSSRGRRTLGHSPRIGVSSRSPTRPTSTCLFAPVQSPDINTLLQASTTT